MKISIRNSLYAVSVVLTSLMLQACPSSGSNSDEDTTGSTVTLAPFVPVSEAERLTTTAAVSTVTVNGTTELVGAVKIKWTNNEPNRSTVDISLSSDGGATFPTIVATRVPDSGEYVWDTYLVDDCRTCRLRIVARDVVGNVGAPSDSAQDFIINNVPQVLGTAIYVDSGNNGPGDGDTVVVPFDKEIELRTAIASDIFIIPVLGDNIGPFATVAKAADANELVVTFNSVVPGAFQLHPGGLFDSSRLGRTAPSGINIRDNLAEGILFAPDTNRTAAPAADGIDVTGSFERGGTISGFNADSLAVGDVDNDGDPDLIASREVVGVQLTTTEDDGVFEGTSSIAFPVRGQVALGDVDGDGSLDLLIAKVSNDVILARNNGAGVFTPDVTPVVAGRVSSIALGDVDGDNDIDLVLATDLARSEVRLLRNNGAGIFTPDAAPVYVGTSSIVSGDGIAVGDVDGDGDPDLVLATSTDIRLVRNNGAGVFTPDATPVFAGSLEGIALGDVDNDGDADVVTDGSGLLEPSRVFSNDGTGIFREIGTVRFSGNSRTIAFGDLDFDRDMDLLMGKDEGDISTFLNSLRRPAVFIESGQVLGSVPVGAVALSDLEPDGDLDLIVRPDAGGSSRLWRNNGLGVFIDSADTTVNPAGITSVLGDLDGDGDEDRVDSDLGGMATNVLLRISTTRLITLQTISASGPLPLAFGDIDNDCDPDLVIGTSSGARILLNNFWDEAVQDVCQPE